VGAWGAPFFRGLGIYGQARLFGKELAGADLPYSPRAVASSRKVRRSGPRIAP